MPERTLIVGTRGSDLALAQARRVHDRLGGGSVLHIIKTSGDRFKDKPLHEQDGIGLFTKEIEDELLAGTIDVAVHALKDLPIALAAGLKLGAVLTRDAAADILLVRPQAHVDRFGLPLASGARVGASSLRRQALLHSYRPDLAPVPIRGNVPTRIEKAVHGDFDAIILSRAGLERLRLDVRPLLAFDLNPAGWVGAPGQGTIAVEVRADDTEACARVLALDDPETRRLVETERRLLAIYGGGCHAPFGSWASAVEGGCQIWIAVPGADGALGVARFTAGTLEAAAGEAEEWLRSGPVRRSTMRMEDWICRPARPWC